MEKEKLGNFVSELRKEKNMTQKELAAILCVTDKAVSKWERGLSYPDISLLEPLAEVFDVSILELIQGEHLAKEKSISMEMAESALDNSLTISDAELKRKHIYNKSIILICCISLMFLISVIMNIINLWKSETTDSPSVDPYTPSYQTIEDENGRLVFKNPDKALSQMLQDSQSTLSDEWIQLLEILNNTLEEEY
ncbi:MAG: helix-turn-helix transcriptional regulator [Lachnospiraceae bacterium]|nr:helix-turn-helix transcriptional regulator [Lachnospiraceae bacterium]